MSSRQPLILIADDDRNLVDALARRCVSIGFQVERAHDGLSALAKIDRLQPQLVILDVNMPGGSGLSVLEMMAGNEHLGAIPVVVLTALEDLEMMRRCHNLLAYFVPKCHDVWLRIEPLLIEHFGREALDYLAAERPALHQALNSVVSGNLPLKGSDNRQCGDGAALDRLTGEMPARAATAEWVVDPAVAESANRPWVLCIDDDQELSQMLKLRLDQHGVGLRQAHTGMDGYRSAFLKTAQAIILDFEIPDGNGYYVLRRLKENPVTKNIPVIILTGHRDKFLERTMYNLGAAEFLNKPIRWGQFWPVLSQYVGSVAAT